MKAWRKHNQKQTARIQELQQDLQYQYHSQAARDKIEAQLKEAQGFYLSNKHERRTQYAAEVATPSYLLLALFKRVGLWTPA